MGSGNQEHSMSEGRTITILGMGLSAVERRWDIMRYIEGTEVWSLNNGYLNYSHILPQFSAWFELHEWQYLKVWSEKESGATAIGRRDHFHALDSIGCKVYCTEHLPEVRNQERIDWVEVFTALQNDGGKTMLGANYFLGSPSLMICLALYQHDKGDTVKEIRSFGIDTNDGQHAQQRASWAYWCAQAHARGIEMTGTALNFMLEAENDKGLIGLREQIGNEIAKKTHEQKGGV
jgi:hypothetical protein